MHESIPILSIIGSVIIIVATASFTLTKLFFNKIDELKDEIFTNREASTTALSSYQAQVQESFHSVRLRLSRIEWVLKLNGDKPIAFPTEKLDD